MLMRRSCPRCHGDLYEESEPGSYNLRCLQCGNELKLSRALDVREQPSPALVDELTVTVNASALAPEGRSGRPGMYRKFPRRRSPIVIPGLPQKHWA